LRRGNELHIGVSDRGVGGGKKGNLGSTDATVCLEKRKARKGKKAERSKGGRVRGGGRVPKKSIK